jgi:hypothetical protein
VIRVEAVWLAVDPLDVRSGSKAALPRAVHVFGATRPHRAYLFANRMKVLVHDGIGVVAGRAAAEPGQVRLAAGSCRHVGVDPRTARRAGAGRALAAHR